MPYLLLNSMIVFTEEIWYINNKYTGIHKLINNGEDLFTCNQSTLKMILETESIKNDFNILYLNSQWFLIKTLRCNSKLTSIMFQQVSDKVIFALTLYVNNIAIVHLTHSLCKRKKIDMNLESSSIYSV